MDLADELCLKPKELTNGILAAVWTEVEGPLRPDPFLKLGGLSEDHPHQEENFWPATKVSGALSAFAFAIH
jgi:hypothetical protein